MLRFIFRLSAMSLASLLLLVLGVVGYSLVPKNLREIPPNSELLLQSPHLRVINRSSVVIYLDPNAILASRKHFTVCPGRIILVVGEYQPMSVRDRQSMFLITGQSTADLTIGWYTACVFAARFQAEAINDADPYMSQTQDYQTYLDDLRDIAESEAVRTWALLSGLSYSRYLELVDQYKVRNVWSERQYHLPWLIYQWQRSHFYSPAIILPSD